MDCRAGVHRICSSHLEILRVELVAGARGRVWRMTREKDCLRSWSPKEFCFPGAGADATAMLSLRSDSDAILLTLFGASVTRRSRVFVYLEHKRWSTNTFDR